MFKKVIKITEENYKKLGIEVFDHYEYLVGCVGKYILADFGEGSGRFGSVVTEDTLNEFFEPTGKKLKNDWVEYESKL